MNFLKWWIRPRFEEPKVEWLFAHFRWLLENYGGHDSFLRSYHLVMANRNDFPSTALSTERSVEEAFQSVMKHMGMGDWAVELVPLGHGDDPEEFEHDQSEISMEYSSDGVGGYFHLDSRGRARIGYGPHLVSDFMELISVLSHEAAHYLLTKSITVMPGGWKDLEPVTDLTAIFAGFGLFQANTASVVRHYSGGHSSSVGGYLPESGRAYALAIFSELSLLDAKFVAKHLRPNPRASYRAAIEDIRQNRKEKMRDLESLTPMRKW
ncbi:MAG: hypothetical protein KDM63_10095 [Verrucomicrobiae bacterium]|nr:hypothetical protein [Verrucomicrobiae bacterium]